MSEKDYNEEVKPVSVNDPGILRKLVETLYLNSSSALIGSMLGVAILIAIFFNHVSLVALTVWGAYMLAVSLVRYRLVVHYRTSTSVAKSTKPWEVWFYIGVIMNGLGWGSAVWVLFSPDALLQAILYITLAGMMAAGVVALAAKHVAVICFLTPITILGLSRLVATNETTHFALAAMLTVFSVFLYRFARMSEHTLIDSLKLRYENKSLLKHLKSSNKKLTDTNQRYILLNAELTKMRDEALDLARAKSEFLATMSHEIRTPMNGVLGMTELLLGTPLEEKQRRFANIVHRSGESLLHIINDVLDYSKIEAGRLVLEMEPFSLRKLIEDTGEDFSELANDNGIELICHMPPDLSGTWLGDQKRLHQILTNLVGNAIKFTAEGEVVLVLHQLSDDENTTRFRFEVKDTGIGIDEKVKKHIFDSFTQADGSTTRKYGGTGLGLSISRQLVGLMGGEIHVESVSGGGSVFWFEISLTKNDTQPLSEMPSSPLHDLRVLVVDDNETNREILHHQLISWKMQENFAVCGQDGLDMLRSACADDKPYDLVILDMHMPEMDGLQMAQQAQADPAITDSPILLLSSVCYAESEDVLKAAGICCHLTKPVRQSELYDRITNIMSSDRQGYEVRQKEIDSSKQESVANLNGTILLVEDNPVNQEVALGMLETLHCTTTSVDNGLRALECLDESSYDLILMDCQMPEMDGFTATKVIRKRERYYNDKVHIPIIALTANAMAGDRERCLEAGMDDYLSKPISLDSLTTSLQQWLPSQDQDQDNNPSVEVFQPADTETSPYAPGLINPQALSNIRSLSGGDALVARVITAWQNDAPLTLAALRGAVAQCDTDAIQAQAHKFKSSNTNLGAEHLAELCRQLEVLGQEGEVINSVQRLIEIEAEYENVANVLKVDYLWEMA